PCTTPDNAPGECILLRECHSLREMIAKKVDGATEFVRQSVCGYVDVNSLVCCAFPTNKSTSNKENKRTNNKHLLPSRKYCGLQHSDDYSHDTKSSAITEFPWLARLLYRSGLNSKTTYRCQGSLINNKYVLTAGHCVAPWIYVLIEVRLGEFHAANDTDCVLENGIQECSDPVIDYTVNKTIIHPDFNVEMRENNIALIRLNGEVQYSDYIRPICLPLPDTKFPNIGDTMTMSGWGLINHNDTTATIKKKILMELISNEDCKERYQVMRVFNADNYLCTMILENSAEHSCVGDSGGPIMVSHRLQWRQEGIASFRTDCGPQSINVHTRVQKYLEWIEESIEP
ncbi:hypothetical protein ILUMI_18941, partial [Ignelater luminosus]